MIGKHLKNYKEKFKKEVKKYQLRKNNDWRKRWSPFIKYDQDFDGGYFLILIVYKLHILLDFYMNKKNCMQCDESRLEIVASLLEACRLGDLLLDDDFQVSAREFYDKHCTTKYEKIEDDKNGYYSVYGPTINWDKEENKVEYDHLLEQAEQEKQKTKQEFFKYLADHYEEWWD